LRCWFPIKLAILKYEYDMKTYFSDIVPRIKRFSKELDNQTLLTNQHWVVIDDIDKSKNVYIFRPNNELLISQNGKIEKAKWEYLGHNSLLIDRKDESFLFKHGFFDENILALKVDSNDDNDKYAFLVNETKFDKELNSSSSVIEFLNRKYIEPHNIEGIQAGKVLAINNDKDFDKYPAYVTPNHKIKIIVENRPLLGRITKEFHIEFEDGEIGIVYKRKNQKVYFKDESSHAGEILLHYYENLDLCINALHYYLKTGKKFDKGYIITY